MTNDNADAAGEANSSDEVRDDRTAPAQAPRDPHVDRPRLSGDLPHIVDSPLPESGADISRQQRALRRVYRNREVPSWAKRIRWIIFPVYGFMRLHDPNYEKHYEQWQEQERRAGD
jgi:hypothetical protein